MVDTKPQRRKGPRWNSVVAAAAVMARPNAKLKEFNVNSAEWQERAWDFYDKVGELRFGAGWIGNGLSRMNLVASTVPTSLGDEPTQINTLVDDEADERTPVQRRAEELVASIAGGPVGQGQMLHQFGEVLTVGGIAYMVAEPKDDVTPAASTSGQGMDSLPGQEQSVTPMPPGDEYERWAVVSDREIRQPTGGKAGEYEITDEETGKWRPLHPDALVVRVWRRHPARRHEPDAAVRGALPVLLIIQMLTERIIADAQSRLAGSGLLILPNEMTFPASAVPESEDDEDITIDDADAFQAALQAVMTAPIGDRSHPSAVVPLSVFMPGELIKAVQHLRFSTDFADKLVELLNLAIRRLALAMDMPPEVLLGLAESNHWTAWQIEETAVTLHLEPLVEVIDQALTEGFLWPALEAEGFPTDEARTVMVWHDASDLTASPDNSKTTQSVYDVGEASGAALRREANLSEEDKPDDEEARYRLLIKAMSSGNMLAPGMLAVAGVISWEEAAQVVELAKAARATQPQPGDGAEEPAEPAPEEQAPPEPSEEPDDGEMPEEQAQGLLAACDGMVWRALERAGGQLRNKHGRGTNGGAARLASIEAHKVHTVVPATSLARADTLLVGAWRRVPEIAERYGVDAMWLEQELHSYAATLIEQGIEHTEARLAAAIGLLVAA